jgi:hypothetical protein
MAGAGAARAEAGIAPAAAIGTRAVIPDEPGYPVHRITCAITGGVAAAAM